MLALQVFDCSERSLLETKLEDKQCYCDASICSAGVLLPTEKFIFCALHTCSILLHFSKWEVRINLLR